MAFPQINAEQVAALTEMAIGDGAISVIVPDTKKDSYKTYSLVTAELCDLNQLVIMGLLKEITDECGDKLAEIFSKVHRLFRVFEITEIGKKMFDGVERKIQ